jgi:hypothetical protein
MDRLHLRDRDRPLITQPLRQPLQGCCATDKRARHHRHVEDRRAILRTPHPLTYYVARARSRECGRLGGLRAPLRDTGQQRDARRCLSETDDVDVRHRAKQPVRPALAHPDRHQPAPPAGWVLTKRRRPLRRSVRRHPKRRRQHRNRAPRDARRRVHLQHEVRARKDVPRLHDRAKARMLELPRDPLRPRPVRARIAHEEIDRRIRHATIIALPHLPRLRPSASHR